MAKKDMDTDQVAIEAMSDEADDNLITLSTGVILRGKTAPVQTLIKVIARFTFPDPPEYVNKTTGRTMQNPDDPNYIKRVNAIDAQQADAVLNVLILGGTEIVSVPKKFPKPEDDLWIEEYSMLDPDIYPENKYWRYLTWVKFKAAPEGTDSKKIQEVAGRLSGLSEDTVKAAETFPGGG